jgi:predicted permease
VDRRPFSGFWTSTIRPIETEFEEDGVTLAFNRVGAGYFEAMGVEIVAGRALTDLDDAEGVHNLVIGQTATERLWPGQEGVGQRFRWRNADWVVVGVAEDAKYGSLGEAPIRRIYVPQGQVDDGNLTFVLRTAVPARTVAAAAERAIHEVDPSVAVFAIGTLEELLDGQTRPYRAMAVLVGLFGSVALFLAAVGLYGVQAYLVGRRSKEIGIRMALGAKANEVAAAILGRGAFLSALGIAICLVAAFGLARVVEGMLFGVGSRDPVTFVSVAAVLLAVSLAASYVPARRAARVDPMRVLREE